MEKEVLDIWRVFDKNCAPIPTVALEQESSPKQWIAEAPLYHPCTILAEMILFLIICTIFFVAIFICWRRHRRSHPQKAASKLQILVLALSILAAPLLAYILLLLILMGVLPVIIQDMLLGPPEIICSPKVNDNIGDFRTEAYRIKTDSTSLAVLKVNKKPDGFLSHRNITVFYTYGRGDTLMEELGNLTLIAQHGMDVYGWDLPGFGASEGSNDPSTILSSFSLLLDFVADASKKRRSDVLIWGHSMGGAISALGAAEAGSRKLILHNPMDDLEEVASDACRMTGMAIAPLFFRSFMDTRPALESLAANGSCLLMYSSVLDQLVPFDRQTRLFDRFNVSSPGHCAQRLVNDWQVHDRSPWADINFEQKLKAFLDL